MLVHSRPSRTSRNRAATLRGIKREGVHRPPLPRTPNATTLALNLTGTCIGHDGNVWGKRKEGVYVDVYVDVNV